LSSKYLKETTEKNQLLRNNHPKILVLRKNGLPTIHSL